MASFCIAAGIDETGWHDGTLEIGLDRLGSFLEKLQEEASVFFRRIRRKKKVGVGGLLGLPVFVFSAASGSKSDSLCYRIQFLRKRSSM